MRKSNKRHRQGWARGRICQHEVPLKACRVWILITTSMQIASPRHFCSERKVKQTRVAFHPVVISLVCPLRCAHKKWDKRGVQLEAVAGKIVIRKIFRHSIRQTLVYDYDC